MNESFGYKWGTDFGYSWTMDTVGTDDKNKIKGVTPEEVAEFLGLNKPEPFSEFVQCMSDELNRGEGKYGKGDSTLEFIRGVDPSFELGAIAKYVSRIAHGDSRAETDIIEVATYAYFYWKRHYRP